ncbi:MAG: replicative DNA helicase [Ruminococcaceae bacterium]|nr:replicative DNA helicase [Oscillospiraceae bacterium]
MADERQILDIDGAGLPYDFEAEQGVLASILVDPNCIVDVIPNLKEDYFYIPNHKVIYRTLMDMANDNIKIDFIILLDRLKKEGLYDKAGGKAYLTDLIQSEASSANVMTYVGIVRERYYARALIVASRDIINDATENIMDAGKLLEKAEQRIYEIREGRSIQGLEHIKGVIENETFDRLMKMSNPETRNDYIGIPTGIGGLDKMITGLNKSDLIILGARPGMGKTSFALNIVRNVAMNSGKRVAVFSLEMSRDQLAQRLLSSEAAIKSEKLRTGNLEPDEWTRLGDAAAHLRDAEIYLDESSNITVPEMKAKLRRMGNVGLVVVDYLGLMHSARQIDNRVQEISDITRGLKIMAKELMVPVLVCAQLSRGTESKGSSHKPALSDLRDSGSIEQDADIVLFLYREKYYDNEKKDGEEKGDPNKAECIVAKNRHGEIGTVELYWDGRYTRFTSPAGFDE